ncbi:MAG: exonuclease [Cyanobium sp.]
MIVQLACQRMKLNLLASDIAKLTRFQSIMMSEIYVSTDIETDGPLPGGYSMLSLGSAAYRADSQLLDTFSVNLSALPGARQQPDTMAWWAEHPDAWAACQVDPQPPAQAMAAYHQWLKGLPGKPIFVAYPAGFDFMFVNWYLINFVGDSPFGHNALDIRSYAMAFLGRDYEHSGKRHLPAEWLGKPSMSHLALDDAIQQGTLFFHLVQANQQRRKGNLLA